MNRWRLAEKKKNRKLISFFERHLNETWQQDTAQTLFCVNDFSSWRKPGVSRCGPFNSSSGIKTCQSVSSKMSSQPETSNNKPEKSDNKPETSNSNPETSDSKPGTSISKPDKSYSKPETSISKPKTSYSKPETSISKPKTSNSKPGTSIGKPGTSTSKPEKQPSSVPRADVEEKKRPYPKSVFFIVGNEFCERFSYYGLRAVLMIYLQRILMFHDDTATVIFHSFVCLCYLTPVPGSILSDAYLGKFKTIFYISIVYAIGSIILSAGAFPNSLNVMSTVSLTGLLLISIGTGGIKPCVAAFGGDQFHRSQEVELQRFFSYFYLSINSGSLLSTAITPILREDVKCLGQDSCFALAFGVPAILMIIALVLFLFGKRFYRIVPAAEGNIVVTVVACICRALKNKCSHKGAKKSHWLEYADDKYDIKIIDDIRILLSVMKLYLPLPVFWALFDQQSSTWVIQSQELDGNVYGWIIKPDQMQVLNPLFIVAFIPLFNYLLYPLLAKINFDRPLRKITVGGLITALAFVAAAILQLVIEASNPVVPLPGKSEVTIVNNSPCTVKLDGSGINEIGAFQKNLVRDLKLNKMYKWTLKPDNCGDVNKAVTINFNSSMSIQSMMITVENNQLEYLKVNDSKQKPAKGEPKIRFFYNDLTGKQSIRISSPESSVDFPINSTKAFGITDYKKASVGKYKIYLIGSGNNAEVKSIGDIVAEKGGTYIVSIYKSSTANPAMSMHSFPMILPNKLSILYQIPQFAILTAGEIMLSVTGLEFSYSQAPLSMKSVVQATWLMTTAIGEIIVIIIVEAKIFHKMSANFFFYATFMALDMFVFGLLAYFYKYVKTTTASTESIDIASPTKRKEMKPDEDETRFSK